MRSSPDLRWCVFAAGAALALLAAGASSSAMAQDTRESAGAALAQADQAVQSAWQGKPLPPAAPCQNDTLHRSLCMISLITHDIAAYYRWPWGGGVSAIRALSTTSYAVDLPQEERIDVLTYQFAVEAGFVRMTQRSATTRGPRRP